MTNLTTREKVEKSMAKRRAAETRFRLYGVASILFGLLCLVVLFGDILSKGTSAFRQTVVEQTIMLDGDYLGLTAQSTDKEIRRANFEGLIKKHLKKNYKPKGRKARRALYGMVSAGASWQLVEAVQANPELIGKELTIALLADDAVDQWLKHDRERGYNEQFSEYQQGILKQWVDEGQLYTRFNKLFFTNGDSREPELAGIHGAIKGTLLTLMVTLPVIFPDRRCCRYLSGRVCTA